MFSIHDQQVLNRLIHHLLVVFVSHPLVGHNGKSIASNCGPLKIKEQMGAVAYKNAEDEVSNLVCLLSAFFVILIGSGSTFPF